MANNGDSLQLYYCDLRLCNLNIDSLACLLNETDRQRFSAYKNQLKKRQFLVGRYLIKYALNKLSAVPIGHHYQLVNHQTWRINDGAQEFTVSISHSQDIVLVAVCVNSIKLGVDVEHHKPRDFIELAKMFTTVKELQLLQNSEDKQRTFYRLWTAKEAYYKASSIIELTHIDLSLTLEQNRINLAEYHYYYQTLGASDYSLSLIGQLPFTGKVQNVTIDKSCLLID